MIDDPSLTRNQRRAVTVLGKSVSVTAGPGSGKTELLVRRFRHIVGSRKAAPHEILTLTFTEQDARDMRERLYRCSGPSGTRTDRWALERAHIGTIHGFCRRLLRGNPLEAGVDPRFSILRDVEARALSERLLDEILRQRRDEPRFSALLASLGEETVRDAVFSVYGRARNLGLEPDRIPIAEPEDLAPFWDSFLRCVCLLEKWTPRMPDDDPIPGVAGADLQKARSAAEQLMKDSAEFDWRALRSLRRYRQRLADVGGPPELVSLLDSARTALDLFLAAVLDYPAAAHTRALLALVSDFHAMYSAEKARAGVLDYNDLLISACDLLLADDGSPSEVAVRYRDRLRFANLDGFHDSSRVQMQIIRAVTPPGRLFTVGDARQSIFGLLHGHAATLEEQDGRRTLGVALKDNFRSRPGILAFVNWFFGKVWHEESYVEQSDLKCRGRFSDKETPDVEIILAPRGESSEEGRRSEARAITCRILEMTGHPLPGRGGDPPAQEGRAEEPLRLSDIVILVRSTSSIRTYRQALAEAGIYACSLSRSSQEVSDDSGDPTEAARDILEIEHPEDAVRIMTVHKARALQAPVVFIADLSRGFRPVKNDAVVFSPERGLAVKVRNPLTPSRLETPLSHREVSEVLYGRQVSEEKRLFYVAATRAEDHLVLVGSSDLNADYGHTYMATRSWMGWLEKALELNDLTPQGALSPTEGVRVDYRRFLPLIRRPRVVETVAEAPVSAAGTDEVVGPAPDIAPSYRLRGMSVSQVLDYLECPARYYYGSVVGVPDALAGASVDLAKRDRSARFGSAVHDVLAGLDPRMDTGPQLDMLMEHVEEEIRGEARALVERFVGGKWFEALRSAERVLSEVPFRLMVDGRAISGRTDAMLRMPDGWVIVDYKTGLAEERWRYELQVGIYACAAHRLLGEMPVRVVLLLLSSDAEHVQNTADGRLAQEATSTVVRVMNSIDGGDFTPKPGRLCRYCPHACWCGKD